MKISPPSSLLVTNEILGVYKKAQEGTIFTGRRDPERLRTLRASQLPFCPLQYVLNAAHGGLHSPMSFHSSYFTKVGTVVHEVVQTFLGKSGRFLANWECHVCGKHRKVTHEAMCCGFLSEYHELEIKNKFIVGHIDGIYRDSKGKYWIVDYKTTSMSKSEVVKVNPPVSYIEQIETYAAVAAEQYGLDIVGIMLMFIVRDNPTTPHIWAKDITLEERERIMRRLAKDYELHQFAFNAKTKADLKHIWKNRRCKPHEVAEKAGYCMYQRGCSQGEPDEAIAWFKQGLNKKYIPIKLLLENASVERTRPKS